MICTVCAAPARREIERAVVAREPILSISNRFPISRQALSRHVANGHMRASVVASARRKEIEHAEGLRARLEDLFRRTVVILDRAEAEGRDVVALSAVRELRGLLELGAKLSAEIVTSETVRVGVVWPGVKS